MVHVRLFEGPIEDDHVLDDLEMPVSPRVGEYVTIRWEHERDDARYRVTAVDHLIAVYRSDNTLKSESRGLRCELERC